MHGLRSKASFSDTVPYIPALKCGVYGTVYLIVLS